MPSGTVKKVNRQGTGSGQTRRVTMEPPTPAVVLDADEDFYDDAVALLGKAVEYTVDDTVQPPKLTGLSSTSP